MPTRRLTPWLLLILAPVLLSGCGCRRDRPDTEPPAPQALPNRLVRVLCYHDITNTPKSDKDVTPADFKTHLNVLREGGYQTISCEQLADYFANAKDIPDRSVIISFDDGRTSVLKTAKPLLDEFGFTPVLFVNPGSVGGKGYLGWEDLKTLMAAGYEINSHTVSHMNLTRLDKGLTVDQHQAKARAEIEMCARQIEENLGKAPVAMAYPYGNYDEFAMRVTREAGHRLGFSIAPGAIDNQSDPWTLPRKMVVGGSSLKSIERHLNSEPLHLTARQPALGERLTTRDYTFTAQLLDEDAVGQVQAEGGRKAKLQFDPATRQLTLTTRLNRGANLIRIHSTGTPRRETAWIVVADVE